MTPGVAAVVPVKDGARYLPRCSPRSRARASTRCWSIDSGSRDGSAEIARGAGAEVLEIAPADFGHGTHAQPRARSGRARRSSPSSPRTPRRCPGWRDALLEAFALDPRIGAVVRPASAAARDEPDDRARADGVLRDVRRRTATHRASSAPDDPTFLSNVNAAYRRACWDGAPVRRRPLQRGPGVRPRARGASDVAEGLRAARRRAARARLPAAGVHAPLLRRVPRACARRSGTSSGSASARRCATSAGSSRDDRRWMRRAGDAPRRGHPLDRALAAAPHAGARCSRRSGSRGSQLPAPVQRALSLEGRADGAHADGRPRPPVPDLPRTHAPAGALRGHGYEAIARVTARRARRRCSTPCPGMADRERLHVAFAIPPFSVGSGGHNIIFQLVLRLERMGHTCSHLAARPVATRCTAAGRRVRGTRRRALRARCRRRCSGASATGTARTSRSRRGWQTVFPLLEQHGVRARAYLINDHEPEFYPTSVESIWAAETYRQGLYGIAGSPWLRDLYIERYGGTAGTFQYGVDHDVYYPRPVDAARRHDRLLLPCGHAAARRRAGRRWRWPGEGAPARTCGS